MSKGNPVLGAVVATALVCCGLEAGLVALHVRSLHDGREALADLPHAFDNHYKGVFRADAGTLPHPGDIHYRFLLLKDDGKVVTRDVTYPGLASENDSLMAPRRMVVYSRRAGGMMSVAVEPSHFMLQPWRGGVHDVYDYIFAYGAAFDPDSLPDDYVGSLRQFAVAWMRADGTKIHSRTDPNLFQARNMCDRPSGTQARNAAGQRVEGDVSDITSLSIDGGFYQPLSLGGQTFYPFMRNTEICDPDADDGHRICAQDEPILASLYPASTQCPGDTAAWTDDCGFFGEFVMCHLKHVRGIRVEAQQADGSYAGETYLAAARYIDDGATLPPLMQSYRSDRDDHNAAYEKALGAIPGREKRIVDVYNSFNPATPMTYDPDLDYADAVIVSR